MRHARLSWILVLFMAGAGCIAPFAGAQKPRRAELALEAAAKKEMVEGDLKGAIDLYRQIIAQYDRTDRASAAKALLRMGQCYEKLGLAEARNAYQRIVSEYAEQRETVTAARARLAGLDIGGASKKAGMTVRKLMDLDDSTVEPYSVSMDGRYLGGVITGGNPGITDLLTGKSWKVRDYGDWGDQLGEIVEAVVSRDGSQIAYWLHSPDFPISGTLRIASADGKSERIVYRMREAEKGGEFLRPWDWSPDGKHLAVLFECYFQRPGSAGSTENVPVEIALISLADGSPRVMRTSARDHYTKIQFSPDGKYLAYDLPSEDVSSHSDVRVLPLNGGSETLVAPHPANDTFVAWTPDGDLLLLSERSLDPGLFRVRIKEGKQSGEPELLKLGFSSTRPIGVDRTCRFYYWVESVVRDAMTASIDLKTGRVLAPERKVSTEYEGTTSSPAWSPDGRQMAYFIFRDLYPWAVAIRDLETGRERTVVLKIKTPRYINIKFRWDSQGRGLLIPGEMSGRMGLYRVDSTSGDTTLIFEGAAERMSVWTKDAEWVFFGREGNTLLRKSRVTGEEKVVFNTKDHIYAYSLSPDERSLIVVESQSASQPRYVFKTVPLDGGEVRTLCRENTEISPATMTPDGQWILYMRRKAGVKLLEFELCVLPAKGGDPHATEFSTSRRGLGVTFHPDGKRFAFSRIIRGKNECWVLENFLAK